MDITQAEKPETKANNDPSVNTAVAARQDRALDLHSQLAAKHPDSNIHVTVGEKHGKHVEIETRPIGTVKLMLGVALGLVAAGSVAAIVAAVSTRKREMDAKTQTVTED